MAIRLEKGQRINLEKSNGSKLENICVGVNWGAIKKKNREIRPFPLQERHSDAAPFLYWESVIYIIIHLSPIFRQNHSFILISG